MFNVMYHTIKDTSLYVIQSIIPLSNITAQQVMLKIIFRLKTFVKNKTVLKPNFFSSNKKFPKKISAQNLSKGRTAL